MSHCVLMKLFNRIGGAAAMVAGGAAAVAGGAVMVTAGAVGTVGKVAHKGALLGGDLMEGAINGVITTLHDMTESEQEARAALLWALRSAPHTGPEGVAIQQRLAIAKCFHSRLAANAEWPIVGLDDDFPYDVVMAIVGLLVASRLAHSRLAPRQSKSTAHSRV